MVFHRLHKQLTQSFNKANNKAKIQNTTFSKPSIIKPIAKQKPLIKEQIDTSPASFEEKRISKIINILEIEDHNFGIKLKKARGNCKNNKFQITKKMTATGYGLYAEKFLIKNITLGTQILTEKEFMSEKTRAVYLNQEQLLPEQNAILIKVYKNER